jgi:hypothetical protein
MISEVLILHQLFEQNMVKMVKVVTAQMDIVLNLFTKELLMILL